LVQFTFRYHIGSIDKIELIWYFPRVRAIVVIADIVRSRGIPDRREFQRELHRSLQAVSRRSADSILSPYTITLGDEFQCVYAHARTLFTDLIDIASAVFPVCLRVAIGCGGVTTDINPERALGMDGPAFAAARELLTGMKREKRTVIQAAAENLRTELINAALVLIAAEMERWNFNTFRTLALLLHGETKERISGELEISSRAVYKQIRAHSLPDIIDVFNLVARDLDGGE